MDGFQAEALRRLPLAESVWSLLRYVVSPEFSAELYEKHRGTGSEVSISFHLLVNLISDAIILDGGSGRQSFERAKREGQLHATPRAVYGKLSRLPLSLSQAFLADATQRLMQLLPSQSTHSTLPDSVKHFSVVVIDGKKLKNLAKRVKPLRTLQGKLLGGKGLVGLVLNHGLAVAMEGSLDGEANDAPLTPGIMTQLQQLVPGTRLMVADRQFCDLKIPAMIVQQEDHFLIRYSKKMKFYGETQQTNLDRQGRTIIDEIGWLGSAKQPNRRYVRRITLQRPGEEEVALLTDLMESDPYPGEDLLDVYLQRWTIERVFQEITKVFDLRHLIGSSPQGAMFQFSLSLFWYNIVQVLRDYIAELNQRSSKTISSELLLQSIRKQMGAAEAIIGRDTLIETLNVDYQTCELRIHLLKLLLDTWTPLWVKTISKKRGPPAPKTKMKGGHGSAWKQLQKAKEKQIGKAN